MPRWKYKVSMSWLNESQSKSAQLVGSKAHSEEEVEEQQLSPILYMHIQGCRGHQISPSSISDLRSQISDRASG